MGEAPQEAWPPGGNPLTRKTQSILGSPSPLGPLPLTCTQELGCQFVDYPRPLPRKDTPGARQHTTGPGRAPGTPTSLSGVQEGSQTWCRTLRSHRAP